MGRSFSQPPPLPLLEPQILLPFTSFPWDFISNVLTFSRYSIKEKISYKFILWVYFRPMNHSRQDVYLKMQAPNDRESPQSLPYHIPTISYSPSSVPVALLTGMLVHRIGIGISKIRPTDLETIKEISQSFSVLRNNVRR